MVPGGASAMGFSGPTSDHLTPSFSDCPEKRLNVSMPIPGFTRTSSISVGRITVVCSVCAATNEQNKMQIVNMRRVMPKQLYSYPNSETSTRLNCCQLVTLIHAVATYRQFRGSVSGWQTNRKLPDARLRHSDWNQLLRGFPELPVDEIGCEATHEGKLFGLSRADFQRARLKGCKRLLHQLVGGDHSDAAFGHFCRHVSLHSWRHEFDHIYAGILQLEPQRLSVGVDGCLAGGVDRRGRHWHKGKSGGHVDHGALVSGEEANKRG